MIDFARIESYKYFFFIYRDFKLNICHVTYYCIYEKIVKIGEINPKSKF